MANNRSLEFLNGIATTSSEHLDAKYKVLTNTERDALITGKQIQLGFQIYHVLDAAVYYLKEYPTEGSITGVVWEEFGDAAYIALALATKYDKTGGLISGDVTITGNLYVNGSSIQVDSEIKTAEAIIYMNEGEAGPGVTLGYSGLYIDRGTEDNFFFGFDEVRDRFTVGKVASLSTGTIATTQVLATRADTLTDQAIVKWDNSLKEFIDSGHVVSELDNVAYKNIDNNFSVVQTFQSNIDASNDIDLSGNIYIGGSVTTLSNDDLTISTNGTGVINVLKDTNFSNDIYGSGSLSISADVDSNHVIGRARISSHVTDYMYLSHYDFGTSSNYALAQTPTGSTRINAPTGQTIVFAINNSTKYILNSDGSHDFKSGTASFGGKIITSSDANIVPTAETLEVTKFGLMGNRSAMYITNAQASSQIILGLGSTHSGNNLFILKAARTTINNELSVNDTGTIIGNIISTDNTSAFLSFEGTATAQYNVRFGAVDNNASIWAGGSERYSIDASGNHDFKTGATTFGGDITIENTAANAVLNFNTSAGNARDFRIYNNGSNLYTKLMTNVGASFIWEAYDGTDIFSISSTGNINVTGTATFGDDIIINNSSIASHLRLKRMEDSFENTWDITLSGGGGMNQLTLSPENAVGYDSDDRLHISANRVILSQLDNAWDLGTSAKKFKNIYAYNLFGDGSNITNISSVNLPSNVAYKDSDNNFSSAQSFNNLVDFFVPDDTGYTGRRLRIDDDGSGNIAINSTQSTGASGNIRFQMGNSDVYVIDSSGNHDFKNGTATFGGNLESNGTISTISTSGTGIKIITGSSSEGYLIFGDAEDNSMGVIAYNNSTDSMHIDANNLEVYVIDSSGHSTWNYGGSFGGDVTIPKIFYGTSYIDIRTTGGDMRLYQPNTNADVFVQYARNFSLRNSSDNELIGVSQTGYLTSVSGATFGGDVNIHNGGNFTTGLVLAEEIRTKNGQQLVLNAGEANSQATGQTNEYVYVNAENGLEINSSSDNWGSAWAGRSTTTINSFGILTDEDICIHEGKKLILDNDSDKYAFISIDNVGTWSNGDVIYASANEHSFVNGEDNNYSNITAGGFTKDGGTSSQFLKADGSVDSNTYLSSASLSSYAKHDTVQSYSKQQYFAAKDLAGMFSGSTLTWDLDDGQVGDLYLESNITLANPATGTMKRGATYMLSVKQDTTGGWDITYGSLYEFGDDGEPTLSTGASKTDILTFVSDGTRMFFTGIKKGFDNWNYICELC